MKCVVWLWWPSIQRISVHEHVQIPFIFFMHFDAKISVTSVGAKGCQNLAGWRSVSWFWLNERAPSSSCAVIWEFISPSKLWSHIYLSGFFFALFNLLPVHQAEVFCRVCHALHGLVVEIALPGWFPPARSSMIPVKQSMKMFSVCKIYV